MLQHYYSQILELHEDYKQEYAQDLDFFISRAKEMLDRKDEVIEQQSSEPVGSEVCIDDVKFREAQEDFQDSDKNPEQKPSKKSDAPEWARKLYKKIALMTHPDRVGDENLRETLRKSFMKANRALEDGKLDDLLGVAIDLGVDAGLEDDALIPLLTAKVASCRGSIEEIESTPEFQWGETLGMKDHRTTLLGNLLRDRGYDLDVDQVKQILSERIT